MRRLLFTFLLLPLAGCVVHDGNQQGEAPIWYPAFAVREGNTTREWGGQNIYGVQTHNVDPKKQSSIGSPGNSLPVNPPDSLKTSSANWNDASRFYVAGGTSPVQRTTTQNQYGETYRPPGSATLYPTRGDAAQSVSSPTLYPPTGRFRTDQSPSLYPNGATGEKGYTGK